MGFFTIKTIQIDGEHPHYIERAVVDLTLRFLQMLRESNLILNFMIRVVVSFIFDLAEVIFLLVYWDLGGLSTFFVYGFLPIYLVGLAGFWIVFYSLYFCCVKCMDGCCYCNVAKQYEGFFFFYKICSLTHASCIFIYMLVYKSAVFNNVETALIIIVSIDLFLILVAMAIFIYEKCKSNRGGTIYPT